jgi:hypothetical protein
MATTVRLSEAAKERLERLQAKLRLRYGRRFSLQEILERALELGEFREEELLMRLVGLHLPLPEAEVDRLLRLPADWGVETREEDIDELLYGGKA